MRKFEKKQELRLASLLEGRTNELSVVPYALALSYGIENAAGRQGVKVTFFLSKNLGGICAHVNKQAEARKAPERQEILVAYGTICRRPGSVSFPPQFTF